MPRLLAPIISCGKLKIGKEVLLIVLSFSLANLTACGGSSGNVASHTVGDTLFLNHDLSSGNLLQWTHRDYGLGTDVGSNASGAGCLWYHLNVGGRRAAGMTATPTAHASPAAGSDSVYLWDPSQFWNHAPYEIWLRTSVMFPSAATIAMAGAMGEAPFQPTAGEWNWFLEFHNDGNPLPSCAREFAHVALDVTTDPAPAGTPGTQNVRMAVRIMGGNDCAPNIVWVNGPPLAWDQWYDILLHIKWDAQAGIFEWYLNNFDLPYYSNLRIPTLYVRPAGYASPSYTSLTAANYRWHATWKSTIYLGPLRVASSRGAVLNAF